MSKEEYETIKAFSLHPKWSSLVSRLYLFTCSPEVSLERETALKLTLKGGTAMNPETLARLLEQYRDMQPILADYPVYSIDTTEGTSPRSTAKEIAEDLLSLLESIG